jgi:hypothetical protein
VVTNDTDFFSAPSGIRLVAAAHRFPTVARQKAAGPAAKDRQLQRPPHKSAPAFCGMASIPLNAAQYLQLTKSEIRMS